ncbi:hypothetical protein QQG74_09345 [Micromonospora sp. FIMYZ51]|uniref:hypothetical protein n=1 Tax=Micromonospora sp. FIMYZ51 TaxID=3051832 RepID=UPI00311F7A5E
MTALVDVAWIADPTVLGVAADDPDLPTPVAHRIGLTTGALVCAPWLPAKLGRRVPEAEARATATLCPDCWPDTEE